MGKSILTGPFPRRLCRPTLAGTSMLHLFKPIILLTNVTVLCFGVWQPSSSVLAQSPTEKSETTADEPALQRPEILKRQTRLARQYELLEEKLFTLYGFERDKNPTRSKLLEKAFQRSQSSATNDQLKEVVALIESAKLPRAQEQQEEVLDKLKDLLALLQSEDRSKRLKDEIERYQEYLKEVEKLLRLQKGLRGQAEGGSDAQRIAKSESQAAERAGNLSDQIKANEEEAETDDEDSATMLDDPENVDPSEEDAPAEAGEDTDGEGGKADSDNDSDQKKDGSDSEAGPKKSGDSSEDSSSGEQGNSEGQPNASEDSQGKSGQSSDSQGQPGQSPEQTEPPAPPANPIRERIDAAQDRMKEAQKKLQEARRDDAIEEMKEAEKEIAQAKKQLEEILRQMREEEVERTLAKLEERFRKMLEREIKVKQSTEKLSGTAKDQRSTEFDVQTGKLSTEQNSIGADAGRALLLLAEDGSSVAFLQTVEEMHQDMTQIAARLSSAKVGNFTIDLETEVIDTLNYLVSSLAETQRENEEKKDSPPPANQGTPPPPGEEPLVGKIAELKMLRSLQDRIYRRHQRYSKQLERPDDPVGTSEDPELVAALKRLTAKQKKLTRITQEIVHGSKQ